MLAEDVRDLQSWPNHDRRRYRAGGFSAALLLPGNTGGDLGLREAEDGRKAAEIACLGALSTAKAYLGSLDKITGVAKLGVYIATEGDFRDHPKVADGASELLVKVFGAGMLSGRIVLGVASLPLGMPIEIELVFEIAG